MRKRTASRGLGQQDAMSCMSDDDDCDDFQDSLKDYWYDTLLTQATSPHAHLKHRTGHKRSGTTAFMLLSLCPLQCIECVAATALGTRGHCNNAELVSCARRCIRCWQWEAGRAHQDAAHACHASASGAYNSHSQE